MKLKTNELKKFNSYSSSIKANSILPIFSYLKFKDGVITKSSSEQFIEMEADFKGKCLIDERALMAFVNAESSDEINVEVKGNSILLSSGKRRGTSPTEDINNFPKSEFNIDNAVSIPNEIISSIKIASNFTLERENMPYTSCVFLGRGLLGASTGFVAYIESIDKSIPEIILDKPITTALKSLSNVLFSETGSWQFIQSGAFNFGFRKREIKFVNFLPFLNIGDEEGVKTDKSEIIAFCNNCIATTPSSVVVAKIEGNKLTMNDADFGVSCETELPIELGDFTFNPSFMGKLLMSLPDEEVTFIKNKDRFYITGKSGFTSLIMQMQ